MKIEIISPKRHSMFKQVVHDGMQKNGFLKKAPVEQRLLFMKDAEMTLNFASTDEWASKNLKNLVRSSKWRGIPKAIIKQRPGLLQRPQIKEAGKNTLKLQNALMSYFGIK